MDQIKLTDEEVILLMGEIEEEDEGEVTISLFIGDDDE